jgi:hypothetical protein
MFAPRLTDSKGAASAPAQPPMMRITINQAAFDAIASTLPLGSVAYEQEPDANGQRQIWLAAAVVKRLRALRGPGESYSDVIRRLVGLVKVLGWPRGGFGASHFRNSEHVRILGSAIIRVPSEPVIICGDSKHHCPNCWIVSLSRKRPHFFGPHAPVRCPLEEIATVRNALAPHGPSPFPPKKRCHAPRAPPHRRPVTTHSTKTADYATILGKIKRLSRS